MKAKRILSALILVIVSCCFVCLGCKKDGNPPGDPPAQDIVVNGVKIETIEIIDYGGSFTCEMLVSNDSEEDIELDASRFVFKLNNATVIEHDGSEEYISADQEQEIILLLDAGNNVIKENYLVAVYYNNQFLTNLRVEGL